MIHFLEMNTSSMKYMLYKCNDSPSKTPQYLNDLDLLAAVKLAVYQRSGGLKQKKKILFQVVASLFTMASWYMLIGIYQNL